MSDIKQFPVTETVIGTPVAIGITPELGNPAYIAFATFEHNGRLEHYQITCSQDYRYLLWIMGLPPYVDDLFRGGNRRKDLAVEHSGSPASSQACSIRFFAVDGARIREIPQPAPNPVSPYLSEERDI